MDELLKLLKKNALETPEDLAKMLDLPVAAVKAKIAEYEKSGVIRGYQAVVNQDQLDIDLVTAVIEVKVTPEREGGFNRIAERISKFNEVQSLHLMSGTFDLLIFISGQSLKDVAFFVSDKLATIPGVLSTSTHFMLKTYKDHGFLMESQDEYERLKVTP
jgi:DNA-binding Lrp family transcriptional regulator